MNNHNLAYVADMNNDRIRLIINHTIGYAGWQHRRDL